MKIPNRCFWLFTTIILQLIATCGFCSAETFNAGVYCPISSGAQWTYIENGLNSITRSVLPGTENVNGIATKVILQTGGDADDTKFDALVKSQNIYLFEIII